MDRREFALRFGALGLAGTGALGACSEHSPPAATTVAENAGNAGRLAGTVTRGPTCPVARPGEDCTAPAAGLVLVVRDQSQRRVARATADARGRYALVLSPGRYRVEIEGLQGMEVTKDLPAEVAIEAGRETRFDVGIDTGIR